MAYLFLVRAAYETTLGGISTSQRGRSRCCWLPEGGRLRTYILLRALFLLCRRIRSCLAVHHARVWSAAQERMGILAGRDRASGLRPLARGPGRRNWQAGSLLRRNGVAGYGDCLHVISVRA